MGRVVDASVAPMQMIESPSEKILLAVLTLMDAHILEHATLTGLDERTVAEAAAKCSRPIEVINQNGTITLL